MLDGGLTVKGRIAQGAEKTLEVTKVGNVLKVDKLFEDGDFTNLTQTIFIIVESVRNPDSKRTSASITI